MQKIIVLTLFLIGGFTVASQSIRGKLIDAETKNGIPFASVTLVDYHTSVQSNESGEFEFIGKYPVKVNVRAFAVGYEPFSQEQLVAQDLMIEMIPLHLELDEVSVTASANELKRNTVTYVELKSLNELNQIPKTNLGQMLEMIPGVYNSSSGPGISKPVIRGMQGVRVLTLLNGTRIEGQQWGGDHGMGISELGIGAVEVLKGPASLAYGTDALGGVLYLSNEAFQQMGKHVVTASSMFESNMLGTVSSVVYNGSNKGVKILSGIRYSSNADYQLSGGKFVKNSRFQDMNAKLALGWHKGAWVGNFRYDYSGSTIGIPGHAHDSVPTLDDFLTDVQRRRKTLPVQYLTNHIGAIENKFIHGKHVVTVRTSFTLNQLVEHEEKVTIPDMALNTINFPFKVNVDTRLGEQVKLTYGLQGMFLTQKNKEKADDRLVPNARMIDNGLYFLSTWSKNNWKLLAGLRGDLRFLSSETDDKFTSEFSKSYAGINFSSGASYAPSKRTIFRLNATSGFRIPHLSELLSGGAHHGSFRYEIGERNLTTEKAIQLDFSYEYTGEHLSLVVNPFANTIQDYIFIQPEDSVIDGMQVFRYRQAANLVLQTGADIGVHWHPHFAHILHFESTLSYLAMFSENADVYSLIPQPRWTNALIARFQMKGKFKVENMAIQYNYYLPQRKVSPFETASADYGVLDLGLQFALEGKVPVKLQVGARNLTNTNYINHLSRLKTLGLANAGRSFYVKLIINLNL